jgi:hypothetical protein
MLKHVQEHRSSAPGRFSTAAEANDFLLGGGFPDQNRRSDVATQDDEDGKTPLRVVGITGVGNGGVGG